MAAPCLSVVTPSGEIRTTNKQTAIPAATNSITGGVDESVSQIKSRLAVDDIYPEQGFRPPVLNKAIVLLADAIRHIDDAVNLLSMDKKIDADEATHRFWSILPQLFGCRSIGDGFGICVLSMYYALENLRGMPATKNQLLALASVAKYLRSEPFCAVETAIDITDKLVDADLEITSETLGTLIEGLSEEIFS